MAQLAGPRRPARTPPEPAGGSQARHAGAWYCTTRVENAHGTGVREVLYRWHPWFGLAVHVHAAATKADGVYFRCTLNGADGARWQELPAWMFDRAACVVLACWSPSPSSAWQRYRHCRVFWMQ